MRRTTYVLLLVLFLWAGKGVAQQPVPTPSGSMFSDSLTSSYPFTPRDVFDRLDTPDPVTGAAVRVYQDTVIARLFIDRQLAYNNLTISGFRVQVFSSNRQSTAKAEAFRIKDMVKEKFPDRGVYETYSSPFWKVRVGDFRTREEARDLLTELMKAFPEIRNEMYIVPDDISVAGLR